MKKIREKFALFERSALSPIKPKCIPLVYLRSISLPNTVLDVVGYIMR